MQYQKVIVRSYGNLALIRYLIGKNDRVAHLTDNQGLSEFCAAGKTDRAIGFPLSDIFWWELNPAICDGDIPDWSQLKQWQNGFVS